MKKTILAILVVIVFSIENISAQITSVSASPNTVQSCDSVTILFSGTHFCPNDVISGVTHSVSGSVITINVSVSFGACIPPSTPPPFSSSYTFLPSSISAGSYTVRAYYNATLSSNTGNLTIVTCCPNQANAGNDTALCNVSSLQLNANAVSSSATAGWTILSGSGSLNNSTSPNATISNLSYGLNSLVWMTSDTSCTTRDTIVISNFETVSTAITEADRNACEDTTTLVANPIRTGIGQWIPLSLGATFINGSNNPSSLVKFIFPKTYVFAWTVSSGPCPISSDTLTIDYAVLDSAPQITESNFVLTSSVAPQYQWYKDGNVIPGETNQTYAVTSNGMYKVLGSIVGCDSGLFSNEIEILNVGNEELPKDQEIIMAPNPAQSYVRFSGLKRGDVLSFYQSDKKLVEQFTAIDDTFIVDFTKLRSGLYFVRINTSMGITYKKLLIQR